MMLQRYHTRKHIRKNSNCCHSTLSSYAQTGSDLVNFNYGFQLQNASTEEVKNKICYLLKKRLQQLDSTLHLTAHSTSHLKMVNKWQSTILP